MSTSEIVFGVLLVLVILALSIYFGIRQIALLRHLRGAEMPEEERDYERRKAIRRLVSSALSFLLAILLGCLLATWPTTAGYAVQTINERRIHDPLTKATDEEKWLVRFWGGLFITVLVVMLAVLFFALMDLWATRRFARQQYRKISDDRRAMIQGEVNRLRSERNGHG